MCFNFSKGNSYGWKGFYAESLNEALFRGYKTKKNDMSEVSLSNNIIIGTKFC